MSSKIRQMMMMTPKPNSAPEPDSAAPTDEPKTFERRSEAIAAVNAKHSMVNDQGKHIVMYDNPLVGPQRLMKQDFEAKLAPVKLLTADKYIPVSKIWWESPDRSYS
jgi:hypothetical protein